MTKQATTPTRMLPRTWVLRLLPLPATPTAPPTLPLRHRRSAAARGAIAWFALMLFLLNAVAIYLLESTWLRDPEYGKRSAELRARIGENPDRPLVVIVGSSRVVWGVRPGEWEKARPGSACDPLLFNMALLGNGPVLQLMTLQRIYSDGYRPEFVLIEYWPPHLRQDGEFGEPARTEPRRFRFDDRELVHDYYPLEMQWCFWRSCGNAIALNSQRVMLQLAPEMFAKPWEVTSAWAKLDRWGWYPGPDPKTDAERREMIEQMRPYCTARFDGLTIHVDSDRALRETVALARANGAQVRFIYLPESREFQSWYPALVETAAREHLQELSRSLDVPVIDARNWMEDSDLADGFHLTHSGASRFTIRLGKVLAEEMSGQGKGQ